MRLLNAIATTIAVVALSGCAGRATPDFRVYTSMGTEPLMVDAGSGRAWHLVCDGPVDASHKCTTALVWEKVYVEGVTPDADRTAREFFARHPGIRYR